MSTKIDSKYTEPTFKNKLKYKLAKFIVKLERWSKEIKKKQIRKLGGVSLNIELTADMFLKPHEFFVKYYEIANFGKSETFSERKEDEVSATDYIDAVQEFEEKEHCGDYVNDRGTGNKDAN